MQIVLFFDENVNVFNLTRGFLVKALSGKGIFRDHHGYQKLHNIMFILAKISTNIRM